MKRSLAVFIVLVAASALGATTPNLTGQWQIHNSIAGNESDQACTFTQADNKLTGTCKAQDKDVQIIGSVDGNNVTWKYQSEYNGTPLTLTYTAMVNDASKITGSVDVQPFAVTGEFTATPSKPAN
ncbi:MAG TPA: hypothetical protein VGF44_06515 [Terriglobales bacterium]|jgi:hypothetical protein